MRTLYYNKIQKKKKNSDLKKNKFDFILISHLTKKKPKFRLMGYEVKSILKRKKKK